MGRVVLSDPVRISVVTPSFNQAAWLEECVRSIEGQRWPDVEHWVIDGGSTDGSVAILERHRASLAGFVSEKDRGQTDALNKGLRRCTGELIGWQNSDDFYYPGAFASAARAAERHPRADLFFANARQVDTQGRPLTESRYAPLTARDLLYEGMLLTNQALFFRRCVLERAGYPDETLHFAMDFEFFVRMLHQGMRAVFVHEVWGAFRQQPQAKTAPGRGEHSVEMSAVRRRYGLDERSASFAVMRRALAAKRALALAAQGDIAYVLRGVRRRLLGGPPAAKLESKA